VWVAKSNPDDKEIMIKLVMNLIRSYVMEAKAISAMPTPGNLKK
jgi:hypothetical protein